jgi:hypothetical protein
MTQGAPLRHLGPRRNGGRGLEQLQAVFKGILHHRLGDGPVTMLLGDPGPPQQGNGAVASVPTNRVFDGNDTQPLQGTGVALDKDLQDGIQDTPMHTHATFNPFSLPHSTFNSFSLSHIPRTIKSPPPHAPHPIEFPHTFHTQSSLPPHTFHIQSSPSRLCILPTGTRRGRPTRRPCRHRRGHGRPREAAPRWATHECPFGQDS